ncbi:hypothetical protein [Anaerobacillus alkaliphilus]|nr:hypothetical protein [Anaerobacillus alkaliphilus]
MTQQTMKHYINEIMNKYVVFFDVYRGDKIGQTPLAFSALYKRRDEKYLITKTIKVWGIENQQCVFAATREEPLTKEFIQQFERDIRENINSYVAHHKEHMSTIFLGVVVTDQPVTEAFIKGVRKYRKVKFIKYGMHGWAELYLAIVDLHAEKVYVHRKGDTYVEPFLKSLLKKEEQT